MDVLIKILIAVGAFLFMEFVAWFTHKYIMHGILWTWHKSHHTVHNHALEKNDFFALVFSLPSVFLIYLGTYYDKFNLLLYVGIGILAYGIFYFIFHDIIVHRRVKIKYKAKNKYMKRIMNAHYIHHKRHTKKDCEAFGFLWAPNKYSVEKK